MVVRAAGDKAHAALLQRLGEHGGIFDHLLLIGAEGRLQRLAEADRLAGDDVHERAALRTGEDGAVDLFGKLVPAEDDRAARAAQRLVRRAGDDIGIRHRARVHARGDEAADVRHVDHQVRADGIGNSAEARKVDHARIGARPGDDELRSDLLGHTRERVIVDGLGLGVDAVKMRLKIFPGQGRLAAVRQVAAVGEVHAEDAVARLQQRRVHGHIRLRAGVRLDIGMVGAEEPRHAVDGQTLDLVDVVAAAVIARAGVALGVLIRQVAAHGLHHGRARKILGRDQLQMVALAPQLPLHGGVQLRVGLLQMFIIHIGNLRLCQNCATSLPQLRRI